MAFEIAFLLFLGVVIVVAMVTLARPMTEMFAEKTKFKYREMGSETEKLLKDKINILEGEIIELKRQLTSLQETSEFLSKEVESMHTIKVPGQKEQVP